MTQLTIRIDEKLKKDAKKVFEKHGLDMSSAIKMFFSQAILEKGIPFQPTHNKDRLAEKWDREVAEALASGKSYTPENVLVDI